MKIKSKFQDEDFEVGEIVKADINSFEDDICLVCTSKKGGKHTFIYNSLDSLREEWEDYEKPKMFYWIDYDGKIRKAEIGTMDRTKIKQIDNYFETREEAEKAVEKLRAWKRLRDKGFKLNAVVDSFFCLDVFIRDEPYEAIKDDLKIVFGSEE